MTARCRRVRGVLCPPRRHPALSGCRSPRGRPCPHGCPTAMRWGTRGRSRATPGPTGPTARRTRTGRQQTYPAGAVRSPAQADRVGGCSRRPRSCDLRGAPGSLVRMYAEGQRGAPMCAEQGPSTPCGGAVCGYLCRGSSAVPAMQVRRASRQRGPLRRRGDGGCGVSHADRGAVGWWINLCGGVRGERCRLRSRKNCTYKEVVKWDCESIIISRRSTVTASC